MKRFLFFLVSFCCMASAQAIEIVVHRGANALAPENTLASADSALAYGAQWIEVDVRPSRDSVLFNLHDETLDRTTDGHGRLADMPSQEVRKLDAGAWFSSQYKGTPVPTIAQMLDHLKGKANVFFDVKLGTPLVTLVRLVREKGFAENSFFWFGSEAMLREFILLAPEMKVKVNASNIDRLKYWQGICHPSYVEIAPDKITAEFMAYCHQCGIKVMAACQEDDTSQFPLVIEKNVDMVNLDRPEVFIKLLDKTNFVDPHIGSEGEGRTFIGPSAPFGMVKPGPDAEAMPNAGWAPEPEAIKGFSQTHVSGTGGGQKYGNVLIQPCFRTTVFKKGSKMNALSTKELLLSDGRLADIPVFLAHRVKENISLGYYSCTYDNGIETEITTSARSSVYRFRHASQLFIDVASFLGMDTIPEKRETQQYVGSEIELTGTHEICGRTTVRGGWNNGSPYTVYFCLQSDCPLQQQWRNDSLGLMVSFGDHQGKQGDKPVIVKIGLSYVSTGQARRNITPLSFDNQRSKLLNEWQQLLSRVPYQGSGKAMRMFYTALYHTLLMPVDKTGERRGWDGVYYDDYYALWDTYRTSFPLLMEYYPEQAVDMVNALLNIYQHEGYMPDARSGDCNGRTQGGSNAEVVIAEAFARGLKGIDYRLALEAMLKDAEVAPADDEKEGRGGLREYNTLGYIPYGIPRAGTRTVEYSYDDWCIALVAQGLGRTDLYEKYMKRSHNWQNLWRSDYTWQGMRGFIMPRDREGHWLDSVQWGHSNVFHPTIPYRPDTKAAPWNIAWWDTFFYEALSAEYSLAVPHDVPRLIQLCGGESAFRRRLDIFFANGHYNVGNEPSFLTPYLFAYIGRADLASQCVSQIVNRYFSDTPTGLPGNDDSGAMSAWLIWAMLGRYPVAGQGKYIYIHPVNPTSTLYHTPALPQGGGKSVISCLRKSSFGVCTPSPLGEGWGGVAHFTLNRQYRTWPITCAWSDTLVRDTLIVTCNGNLYLIPRQTVDHATGFCWDSPYRPGHTYLSTGTFLFISRDALSSLRQSGSFVYDKLTWRRQEVTADGLIHVKADIDGTEMWIFPNGKVPFVVKMKSNLLGIDWTLSNL